MNELTTQIVKLQEKHQRETEKLEADFNEKIIVEYENTTQIKQRMNEMKEEYELKLKRSTNCLEDTIGWYFKPFFDDGFNQKFLFEILCQ